MGRAASITVLGAGSWGTALALLLARNGVETLLWGFDTNEVDALKQERQNSRYLPGIRFPDNLSVTSDLKKAVENQPLLLLAVPSHAFRSTLQAIKPHLTEQAKISWATKGLDKETGGLLHESAEEILGKQIPLAVISGPSFAREVAENLPTALTVASAHANFLEEIAGLLHNERFRVYTSNDMVGAQIGGAVKNVMAIAAGISDGLKFGANTRAALITRGLAEMIRLGIALGANQETFMGLAGMGDLILTCTDDQSRNRRMGLGLGKGRPVEMVREEIGQEVEGVSAAKEIYLLAQKHHVEMPITEQIYSVLYESLPPLDAVKNLLARDKKAEACKN
jgi:glycerol-3-phosphate dehydrogenase (NAD(P)+)